MSFYSKFIFKIKFSSFEKYCPQNWSWLRGAIVDMNRRSRVKRRAGKKKMLKKVPDKRQWYGTEYLFKNSH